LSIKTNLEFYSFQFFEIRKDRPMIGLAEVARKIIDDSLPIKCLEAIILGSFLINEMAYQQPQTSGGLNHLEKFTIGFKSASKGNIHRHVVLGVYDHSTGMFGALGMSRRTSLGFKPLRFRSLTELLLDYIDSYASFLHKVKRIKVGMPLANSNRSFESIKWNGMTICPMKDEVAEWHRVAEKHARSIRQASIVKHNAISFLSLRNLTNLGTNNTSTNSNNSNNGQPIEKMRKSNSYLNIHMSEVSQKKCKEEKNEEVDSTTTTAEAVTAEEIQLIKNDLQAQFAANGKNEKFYFPREVPVRANENIAFIKELTKNSTFNSTFNNFSGSLTKRKKVSLRI
jgi:hypothetical protein